MPGSLQDPAMPAARAARGGGAGRGGARRHARDGRGRAAPVAACSRSTATRATGCRRASRSSPRRRGGLDARLAAAFDAVGGPALLIGMDTPQLDRRASIDAAIARARARRRRCGARPGAGRRLLGDRPARPRPRRRSPGVPMSSARTAGRQRRSPASCSGFARGRAAAAARLRHDRRRRARSRPRARARASPRAFDALRMAARRLMHGRAAAALAVVGRAGCGGDRVPAGRRARRLAAARPATGRARVRGRRRARGPRRSTRAPGLAAVITRDPVGADARRPRPRAGSCAGSPLPATGRHLALGDRGGPVLVPVEQTRRAGRGRVPSGRRRAAIRRRRPPPRRRSRGRADLRRQRVRRHGLGRRADGRVEATLDAPAQPGGVAASGGRVVVVAVAERVLERLRRAARCESLGTAPAGVGPTHVVAAGDRAWVADTDGDAILELLGLGAAPRAALDDAASTGAPYGIALDPAPAPALGDADGAQRAGRVRRRGRRAATARLAIRPCASRTRSRSTRAPARWSSPAATPGELEVIGGGGR